MSMLRVSQQNELTKTESVPQADDARYHQLIILLFALALFFYKLGSLALVGPDEPRYAQVAREMFQRHDWVTPTLLGDTWFEKPAMLYWMMISGYHLLGVNEWAARLPNAILATINLFIIYKLVKRVSDSQTGFISAIVLAGSGLYYGFARAASFDMTLTSTFTWALACFHLADTADNNRTRHFYWAGFYFSVGLAVMAKGLVGIILIGAIVGLYLLITQQWRQIFGWHLLYGPPLLLLAASLWYGPVIYQHGWAFIDEFFIQHHFQRYTSNKYHHPGPVYFFVLVILGGLAPWSLYLVKLIVSRIKDWRAATEPLAARLNPQRPYSRLLLLAAIWLIVPLLFFSFSNSKLPGYILPVFPALALLVGSEVARSLKTAVPDRWLMASAVVILLIGIALGIFAGKEFKSPLSVQLMLAIAPVVCTLAIFYWRRQSVYGVSALALMSPLIAIAIATLLFPAIELKSSLAPLSRDAARELQPGEKVIFFNYLQYTPLFYTDGRVVVKEGEAARADNVNELAEYLAGQPSLLVVVRQLQLELLTNDVRFISRPLSSQRDILLVRVLLKKSAAQ